MTPSSDDQVYAEMRDLYQRWFAAIPGHNRAFFERTLADDWHYTNYLGEVRGKAEYLEYIVPVPSDSVANELVELKVRCYDSLAVVHGRYLVAEQFAPPGGPDTRFTAVWARRGEYWEALAHHATTVTSSV